MLIFKCRSAWPNRELERSRYRLHKNSLDDNAYLEFLGRLFGPLLSHLDIAGPGLDYGCGPVPAMEVLAKQAGRRCCSFDPLFLPDGKVVCPSNRYAFITCSEVLEHMHTPLSELEKLFSLLAPRGILGIMTSNPPLSPSEFASWHYHRDPTHVAFYSIATFQYIASWLNLELLFQESSVTLLRKQSIDQNHI